MLSAQSHREQGMMMKRAGIVMMGLLLPLGQAWSSEAATTSGWQVTPFFGYSSAIDFEKSDEVQPVSRSASLFRLQLVHRLREE